MGGFGRGSDGALWHIWQASPNGAWGQWQSPGAVLTSNPAVARAADGRLLAFVRGNNGALFQIQQLKETRGWSALRLHGGFLSNNPSVGRLTDGRLAVVVQVTNDVAYITTQVALNQGWGGWKILAGARATSGALVKRLGTLMEEPEPVPGEDLMPEPVENEIVTDLAE